MEASAYDLIVVGAGPAGSACAITAVRAGARVLLLDKDSFPRHKVCGEFVSPESLHILDSLLGANKFSERPTIPLSRIFLDSRQITVPVEPAASSIPRYDLDAALLLAARRRRRGCTRRSPGARCSSRHERHNDDWRVHGKGRDQRQRKMVTAHATRVTRYNEVDRIEGPFQ